jgi:hypothetical protein
MIPLLRKKVSRLLWVLTARHDTLYTVFILSRVSIQMSPHTVSTISVILISTTRPRVPSALCHTHPRHILHYLNSLVRLGQLRQPTKRLWNSMERTSLIFPFHLSPLCLENMRQHHSLYSKCSALLSGAWTNIGITVYSPCSCWLFSSALSYSRYETNDKRTCRRAHLCTKPSSL